MKKSCSRAKFARLKQFSNLKAAHLTVNSAALESFNSAALELLNSAASESLKSVTLNLFQGLSNRNSKNKSKVKQMLKQVQHDDLIKLQKHTILKQSAILHPLSAIMKFSSVIRDFSSVIASPSSVIASEAKQSRREYENWIAAVGKYLPRNDKSGLQSFRSLAMTPAFSHQSRHAEPSPCVQARTHRRSSAAPFAVSASNRAFSLVEMLMALLVASLLLAALAPVMTRRMNENVVVQGNMSSAGAVQFTKEIEYGSEECSDIKVDSDGSTYCEGEYEVKGGYNGYINVTVIGAGGGGGIAPTAGYTEYTTAQTHSFQVPAMVGNIEATLVSGGGGGGAGGQIEKTQTFVTYGNGNMTASANDKVTVETTGKGTWTIPEAARGKYFLATACGGGGGGGSTGSPIEGSAYGGGSGGYILNQPVTFANADKFTYYIGGGGDGGGHSSYNSYSASADIMQLAYGGGASPHSSWSNTNSSGANGSLETSTTKGGTGGTGLNLENIAMNPSGGKASFSTSGGSGGSPAGGNGAVSHWMNCYDGSAGGGGAASQIVVGSGIYLNAPGGGGGSSKQRSNEASGACKANSVSGGGGGGGAGGGAGGGLNSNNGKGGSGGINGNGTNGGILSTIFGNSYCNGGNGGTYISGNKGASSGTQGKSGAIRLRYIDYGPGGSGGGGGAIVPIQPVKVNSGETLTVHIGKGGNGGTAGYLDTSTKTIITPKGDGDINGYGQESYIARNTSTKLLRTNDSGRYSAIGGCSNGTIRNSNYGLCGNLGWVSNGLINSNSMTSLIVPGFSNGCGRTAGGNSETYAENQSKWGDKTFNPQTEGGNGGRVSLFNGEISCEGGKGGTKTSPAGGNATGYGCGGGGGWSFANGGSGSGGYARISWNKYWDTAANSYKLAELGAGGGGASGNVFTYSIPVKSNQVIKFRIGKGGSGAYVSNNVLTQAAKGGATIFGDVKAGGGGAGASVSIDTAHNNSLVNGAGGAISNICHFGSVNYLNNKKCIKGTAGGGTNTLSGGKGADFAGYTMTVITKDGDNRTETKKEIKGTGGTGGVSDTGDNANGKNAQGYASGGGGAALRDVGQVNSASAGNITSNQNKGGTGANGKIILEWYE